ncbi:hypothetical protein Q5O24_15555 [Eubacteriaceae bacterium ES3]|nr:hypothetical protein Q5O24_15555 [Eubacteriaceae bacterium ES3]
MNQIKRKRRLSPLETSVFGNVIYILIVLLFKNVFDVFHGDEFNYFLSGLELVIVALFWIGLFAVSFKNIYAGEKKRYVAYVFYALLPILLLTAAVTVVTIFIPGQDTSSIWNQFTFLAAPTIFWYLPFGLIYQVLNGSITIFTHFAISLLLTLLFQVIGILVGRLLGRKYWLESSAEMDTMQEPQSTPRSGRRKKSKVKSREVIGMEGISDEIMNENFVPEKPEIMTEVIIEDQDRAKAPRKTRRTEASSRREVPIQEKVMDDTAVIFEHQEMPEPAKIPILEDADQVAGDARISDEIISKNQEDDDKSFLMETSQIRVISDEDIEEYYRTKK